jgi:hypothetical protein
MAEQVTPADIIAAAEAQNTLRATAVLVVFVVVFLSLSYSALQNRFWPKDWQRFFAILCALLAGLALRAIVWVQTGF